MTATLILECSSCYGARQMVEAYADDSEQVEIAARHDYGLKAVTIYRGMALCVRHFNLSRGFPPDFPDVLPDADIADKVFDDMETMDNKIRRLNREKRRSRRDGRG